MNKPLAVTEQESAAPVSIMEIVANASRDPNVDVGKLERLMQMAERIEAKQAEQAFNAAMAEAQAEMEPVRTDASNPQTRSRYATHAALDKAIRPTYSKHGFAISYDTGDSGSDDKLRVLAYVSHKAGFSRTYKIDMPADGKGAKGNDVMTKTHATGSAFTYGKRYLEGGIFNIIISDAPDDDGNAAGNRGPITDEQVSVIAELLERFDADIPRFCKYMGVASVKDISASQYRKAIESLNAKGKQK